jgi:hypothetical protein
MSFFLADRFGVSGFFAPGGTKQEGDGRCGDEDCGEVLETEEDVGGEVREAGLVVVARVGDHSGNSECEKTRQKDGEFFHGPHFNPVGHRFQERISRAVGKPVHNFREYFKNFRDPLFFLTV